VMPHKHRRDAQHPGDSELDETTGNRIMVSSPSVSAKILNMFRRTGRRGGRGEASSSSPPPRTTSLGILRIT
jgi:hypothetical protein